MTVFDANDSSGLPSLMYSVSNDVDNSEETNDLVVDEGLGLVADALTIQREILRGEWGR